VVPAAAFVEQLRGNAQFVADWLDNLHRAVESRLVVHLLNHPIDEATQEVAFSKLQNFCLHFFFPFLWIAGIFQILCRRQNGFPPHEIIWYHNSSAAVNESAGPVGYKRISPEKGSVENGNNFSAA
jgi:hypothetical protein